MKKENAFKSAALLDNHHLRRTPVREQVLGLFMDKSHALSHSDIEQVLSGEFDRVTIYRTLTSFLDKGLVHKIPADNGQTRYALCNDGCGEDAHHHSHVHFSCSQCGQTFCLEHIHIPQINLPKGYTLNELNYIASGTCMGCNLK